GPRLCGPVTCRNGGGTAPRDYSGRTDFAGRHSASRSKNDPATVAGTASETSRIRHPTRRRLPLEPGQLVDGLLQLLARNSAEGRIEAMPPRHTQRRRQQILGALLVTVREIEQHVAEVVLRLRGHVGQGDSRRPGTFGPSVVRKELARVRHQRIRPVLYWQSHHVDQYFRHVLQRRLVENVEGGDIKRPLNQGHE